MIRYSERAKLGYARLYRPYNDIDVFVEDETCHNMYEILVNRILGGSGRVTRVFGMGSRTAVEDACAGDREEGGRARLYIVDGDMDILRRRRRKRMKRLYRLKVYCVENILIEEGAVYEVLRETMVDSDAEDVARRIQFSRLAERVEGVLLALWKLYAVVFDLHADVRTISYSVHRFRKRSDDKADVSPKLVRQRMKAIIGELWGGGGRERFGRARGMLRERWLGHPLNGMDAVSGKHCIFPLLYQRCRLYGNYRDTEASLKVRLARHCDVKRDLGLYRALRRQLRNP